MNLSEKKAAIVDKLSKLLFDQDPATEAVAEEVTEETPQKFVDVETVDGLILSIEPEVEAGAVVNVATEEGPQPAADGWHDLADGRRIRTEGGIILELEEAAPAEEEPAEEVEEMAEETPQPEATEQAPKEITERTEVVRKFEEASTVQGEAIEALEAKFNTLTTNLNELLEVVKLMAVEPSAEPTKAVKKNPFKKEPKTTLKDKLNTIRNNKKQ